MMIDRAWWQYGPCPVEWTPYMLIGWVLVLTEWQAVKYCEYRL